MTEIWKIIEEFPNYAISSNGKIKSLSRTVCCKLNPDRNYDRRFINSKIRNYNEKELKTVSLFGYKCVILLDSEGKKRCLRIHRLLYEAFIGNVPKGMVIDHIDGDKENNTLSNLRCVTSQENRNNPNTIKYSYKAVEQLDKDTLEILNKFDSCKSAALALGISNCHIGSVCNGKRKTAGGFKWRWAIPSKVIQQIDLENNIVAEYSSITEAANKTEFKYIGIKGCLLYQKKTYKNYIWKYKQ